MLAALAVAALAAPGCRAVYLARLAVEEARYLASARPAAELAGKTDDAGRREALAVLLDVRVFAAQRGLAVGGSYRTVADVGAASPFHVVTAAPVDRLEPHTWWYPLVGAIPYRGYFDRASAERFAARLARDGLDTRIVEASAYSTLGWFDDPLPSSVLDRGAREVALTVLHELVHQTYFAPGEVAFNETLATAASYRLAADFWSARGDHDGAARTLAAHERWLARGDALDAAAGRLVAFFDTARAESLSRQELLARRAALYEEILAGLASADPDFAAWIAEGGLDNASFLAVHRYATRARAVDAFVAAQGSVSAALQALATAGSRPWALVAPPAEPRAHRAACSFRARAYQGVEKGPRSRLFKKAEMLGGPESRERRRTSCTS